jgi:hypothetical protein
LTGLTQMDVNIDETGSNYESTSIEAVVGFAAQLASGRDFDDATVFEQ